MARIPAILMLAAAAAMGQTPSTKVGAGQKPAGEGVPATEAVITIHGLCDSHDLGSQAAKAGSCTTVVTRQQFDLLLEVLKATTRNIAPPTHRSVAEGYSELLVYSDAARKAGAEKDPRFEQVLRLTRLRALADMYRLHREEQASKVSPQEIQTYYKANLAGFEELQVRRIALPRNNSANLSDLDFRAKATKLAGELRDRAARGEDMDKLQKEAFQALGVKESPATLMVPIRRGAFDTKAEQEIFALKPGQVAKVMEQPSVYIIYKLESRRTPSLDEVKDEISRTLSRRKLDNLTNALAGSVRVEYNDRYFGPPPPSAWVPAGSQSPSGPTPLGASGRSSSPPQKPAPPR